MNLNDPAAIFGIFVLICVFALIAFGLVWLLYICGKIVKSSLMRPCKECKNYFEDNGFNRCRRCANPSDGSYGYCFECRGRIVCKFEKK